MTPTRDTKSITLRLPAELYEAIERSASQERRSINNYIIWLLMKMMEEAE